jgi:hypothetical protein
MTRVASAPVTLALTAVVACGPVACAGGETRPKSIAATTYSGLPSDAPTPTSPSSAVAVWTGDTLELTLWGSGSCPAVPVAMKTPGPATVEITISTDYGGGAACTTDLSPTTSVLRLPDAVAGSATLTVRIDSERGDPVELRVTRSG